MDTLSFSELSLSPEMQKAIQEMGFTQASPIQTQTIPHLLAGRDIIGQAQTGTGKTAAFGIPMIENIAVGDKVISSVILCPTRELAIQVSEELKKLARFRRDLTVIPIYGGEGMQFQIRELRKGVQIVVGTPGRVMDHLNRGNLSFDKVKMIVLDEADEMLNMGFREDIEILLSHMPSERQTVLFSATMPKAIMDIAKRFQKDPQLVKVTTERLTATSIEQIFFETSNDRKAELIGLAIQAYDIKLGIVFCNTKAMVDDLVKVLQNQGLTADGIHGDLNQMQRNKVLTRFRKGDAKLLVATDVAARGIDVSNVDAVFNYDIPHDPEYYVHRIGRTGRAGKTGRAFSFVTGRNDFRRIKIIESYAKSSIERRAVPTEFEVFELKKKNVLAALTEALATEQLDPHFNIVDEFTKEGGLTVRQLSAALLKTVFPVIPIKQKPVAELPHTKIERKPAWEKDRKDFKPWSKGKFKGAPSSSFGKDKGKPKKRR